MSGLNPTNNGRGGERAHDDLVSASNGGRLVKHAGGLSRDADFGAKKYRPGTVARRVGSAGQSGLHELYA